jgi:CheY-like chemotaxis protein
MKKNVLLVDDDHIFNYLNERIIQRMGFSDEIHSARNGQEAIDLLNKYLSGSSALPDIIFLDLNMPVMDGFAFIEAFKRMNMPGKEKISIIVVTSSQDPQDIARAKSLGIDHYLTKPITEDSIKKALAL